jgi:2-polyprenyl-3-methyl-5-hydroxy-6-metoxy-1,4-benzoquinol methylase
MTRVFPNWNEIYRVQPVESMPWYLPGLDPDLARALTDHGLTQGQLLDLGTGPATQAFALAELEFQVTASDLSSDAVAQGQARAESQGLRIQFIQDDILDTRLTGNFDLVFDRGCFHVFAPEHRATYARTVAGLIKPGGLLFLKCFSEEQPGDFGPYRLSVREIEETFAPAFEVLSIEHTVYQGTMALAPKALFCTLRRAA